MNILYEDNYILVVEKPAGTATQSAKVGEPDMETELRKYRKSKKEPAEIYVIHRLDQPVSGILVFAKTKDAAAKLSKELEKENFSKDYMAVVFKGKENAPSNEILNKETELVDYLVKESKTNSSRIALNPKESGAKEARLIYMKISENEDTATLQIHLLTGRHHQIRLQLSNAGMPIIGDLKYGTKESIEYSKLNNVRFVCLKAFRLSFVHPMTGKNMKFELPNC